MHDLSYEDSNNNSFKLTRNVTYEEDKVVALTWKWYFSSYGVFRFLSSKKFPLAL